MKHALSLERVVEVALAAGLFTSSLLMLFGLVGSHEAALRAGILILLFTPVARVGLLTVVLLFRRDILFGSISTFVLAVLASSIWVAFRP
jgi:uncharacterized membrane protein